MKFNTIAQASLVAASAEALNIFAGLEINLPLGISVDLDLIGASPSAGPCDECSDMYHPPHEVIIDDCDDIHNGGWHWVHPCPEPEEEPEWEWGTSTVTATHVSTVIDCGPEEPDCPAHSTAVTTVTVGVETTICPIPITTVCHECLSASTSTWTPPPPTTSPICHDCPPASTSTWMSPPVHTSETWVEPPCPSSSTWEHPPVVTLSTVPCPTSTITSSAVWTPPAVHTTVTPNPPFGGNETHPPMSTAPVVSHPPIVTGAAAAQGVGQAGAVLVAGLVAALL